MVEAPEDRVRPRVFVSSVIEGFEDFRQAAASGVREGGGTPVMAEMFPSLSASPRNACLDGVQSCDVFAIVVGERGGWTAPSGVLAVEEEVAEARRRSLPILAFLQDVKRDDGAARVARALSDYVAGGFRTTFTTPDELRTRVAAAVRRQTGNMQMPTADSTRVRELLEERPTSSHEAAARMVLVPERVDELIPPERIGQRALLDQIYSIAHDPAVRFFDYAHGKVSDVSQEGVLRIAQNADRHRSGRAASIALSQAGETTLEFDATGQGGLDPIGAAFVILEEDLAAALRAEMGMASKLLDLLDPYERLGSLWMGAAIVNSGYRHLFKQRPGGGSVPVRTDDGRSVVAEKPRKVARDRLREPEPEVARLVALFARQLGPGR